MGWSTFSRIYRWWRVRHIFHRLRNYYPRRGVCVCVCAWSGKLVWIQIFSPVFRSRVSRRAPLVNDPNETSVAWGRGEEGYLHASSTTFFALLLVVLSERKSQLGFFFFNCVQINESLGEILLEFRNGKKEAGARVHESVQKARGVLI